ncbi:hypothetical protein T4D_4733 [Trichinella pseudospiralis]|uniref:Uncharacterized protein n=1 Tax=Trichinella pseudospiralis TaxID=6337 RepID=A0A0V1FNT5_TRIPS|nr:hypothetical protein T4D_4733 [Trichinella pseudospiralis]
MKLIALKLDEKQKLTTAVSCSIWKISLFQIQFDKQHKTAVHFLSCKIKHTFLFIKEETFKIETVNNIDQQLLISEWVTFRRIVRKYLHYSNEEVALLSRANECLLFEASFGNVGQQRTIRSSDEDMPVRLMNMKN